MPTVPIMTESHQILLDSNIVIALLDARDVFHAAANRMMNQIVDDTHEIFISDVLVNEVLSVLAKRCEEQKRAHDFPKYADIFFSRLKGTPVLCLYELVATSLSSLKELMVRHGGCFNFHDALILHFLHSVPEVSFATLDGDFRKQHKHHAWLRLWES